MPYDDLPSCASRASSAARISASLPSSTARGLGAMASSARTSAPATPPPRAPEGTPPGKVSSYIFDLKPGDKCTISGPYGEFFIKDTDAEMVYIGGGAGGNVARDR